MADNNHLTSADVIQWADFLQCEMKPGGRATFVAEHHDRIKSHLQACSWCRIRIILDVMDPIKTAEEIDAEVAPFLHEEPRRSLQEVLPELFQDPKPGDVTF